MIENNRFRFYGLLSLGTLGVFLLLSSYYFRQPYLSVGGLVMLVPIIAYFFLYKFKWLYYLMIFVLPLSIHLDNIGLGIGLSLPGEALLIFVLVGVIWRMIFRFEAYKPIIFHPLSLLIVGHIGWMLVSTLMSVLPSVSVKFLILQSIYLLVFYIYGARLFLESGRLRMFIMMYTIGLVPVIFYTLINHYLSGNLTFEASNRPCYPFFNDHTIYGACIAMILPILFAFVLRRRFRKEMLFFLLVLCIGLYFAFSRAVFVSLLLSFVLFICLYFRLKIRWFIIVFGLIFSTGLVFFLAQKETFILPSELKEHDVVSMISSISDPENYSNTERINRWSSAYNMFKERPIFGFGPGTFMFVYGRYQEDITFVSVNDSSMGGAHSEYLKPLSEQGIFGLAFVLAIMLTTFVKGHRLSLELTGSKRKVVIACIVGLTTYYLHGLFNFFLDTDKASVLFWGLIAYIVALDIRFEAIKNKEVD